MPDDQVLLAALAAIRERGAIGERSLTDAVARADRFVDLIPASARNLVDLGSGGGLPGLVIAWRLPHLSVTFVERRASRADLLRRAVVALGLAVSVRAEDVKILAVEAPRSFDVVTARSFAPPAITVRWAAQLLVDGGTLLVSEPPDPTSERWPAELLGRHYLSDTTIDQGIHVFCRGFPT